MKKETFEWVHSWCDYAPNDDLPRVLLVGDSITCGYEKFVREKLRGVAYVDYFATSYAVDSKMYVRLLKCFIGDSHYDLIHFNHGLHGVHMTKKCYEKKMDSVISALTKQSKVLLVTSTFMYEEGNKIPHKVWGKKVNERNEIVWKLGEKYNLSVDDLYSISIGIDKAYRNEDGAHYKEEGYAILSEKVAFAIKENL